MASNPAANDAIDIKRLSLREASTVLSAEIQALINRQRREIALQVWIINVLVHRLVTCTFFLQSDQEDALQRNLERDNLQLFPIQNDGNCLFNSFAHQLHVVLGLPHLDHKWLRALFCDTLDENPSFWKPFLHASNEGFKKLVAEMRKPR
jgi:hypothetical protein